MKSTIHLKDHILRELSYGPMKTSLLMKAVLGDSSATIQGIYKALRALRKEEIVIMHNKAISLSTIWLAGELDRINRIQNTYLVNNHFFKNAKTTGDQSISFTYKSLGELDLFWTHSFLSLEEHCPASDVSIAVAPHDWFPYSRKSTDSAWMKKHATKNRLSWVIITHARELDRKVLKMRKKDSGNSIEWLLANPLHQDENIYYNSIGPYIFKVVLDKKVAKRLNAFVENHTTLPLPKEGNKEIETIMSMRGNFRITLTKSETRAALMRKKLAKYFI